MMGKVAILGALTLYLDFINLFLYLLRFTCYSSLIFIIVSCNRKFIDSLNYKLIAAGTIFSIFGYIQFFFYPNLRNLQYEGWDIHLYRLFSTLFDPNFAGVFLVLAFLLLVSNIVAILGSKIKNSFNLAFICLCLIIVLGSIYLTYSRSALLALLAGIVVFFVLTKKTKLLFPLVIVLFVLLFVFSNFKIEGLNPFRINSSMARIGPAQETLSIFAENPILGVGFNAFRYAQIRYGYRHGTVIYESTADAGSDNSYLFILATTGILGFAAYLKFSLEVIKELKDKLMMKQVSSAGIPSYAAVMVSALFINALFYPVIIAWIFILTGAILNKKQ